MELTLSPVSDDTWNLLEDGIQIGVIRLQENPFHNQHRLLHLDLEDYTEALAPKLLALLRQFDSRPLKCMVASTDTQRIRFLRAAGFRLARRCYERCFPRDWCKSPPRQRLSLRTAERDEPEWVRCAELLYEQYAEKHRSISPLTADFADFREVLPKDVCFVSSEEQIQHFAFLEENEIAYLGSTQPDAFPDFLETLLARLFADYETVEFEADEHDREAMMLKRMFRNSGNHSWNTYLLP